MRISHECLYQWIYAKPQRALDLRQYLARGRKRRTRKKGRKAKGPRIPIELRPDCWTLFIRIQAQTTVDVLRNSSGVCPPSRIWRRLVFQWMM